MGICQEFFIPLFCIDVERKEFKEIINTPNIMGLAKLMKAYCNIATYGYTKGSK